MPSEAHKSLYFVSSGVPCSIGDVYLVLATIVPLLAYPFFRHAGHIYDTQNQPARLLFLICVSQLVLHGLLVIQSIYSVRTSTVEPVTIFTSPLYTTVFALLAAQPTMTHSEHDPAQLLDYDLAGRWVSYALLYLIFQVFHLILDGNSPYAFALAVLLVGIIRESLTEKAARYTHAFMTRDMSPRWSWLTRRTDEGDLGCFAILSATVLSQIPLMFGLIFDKFKDA